ncbi:MAG TPA: lipopolysaccharide transport periplasmic protein LptA [Steroidobacteraceae bacterium]|jgi:lipopolysaccharide transport protein LptA|nr:lipopolysaccharide transport periplasmic protein LptA [Steroidobacteraceae bacterium]
MAPSRSNLYLLCLTLAPLVALADSVGTTPRGAAAPAQPLLINPQQPYNFDAASCDTNYKTHAMLCKTVVLSQGSTVVRADQARAICMSCQDSRWTFQGNVRIDAQPRGNLRSDQAIVELHDNRIVRATANGNPAEFEQQRADDLGMEKGHADQIVYDVSQGTVVLTNDAWVSDGHNEMSAPSISYSIREQKVLANSPGASQGVHIVITPQSAPKQHSPHQSPQQNKGAAPPAPASGAPPPAQPHPAGAAGTTAPQPPAHP